jgi:hypothetical protein
MRLAHHNFFNCRSFFNHRSFSEGGNEGSRCGLPARGAAVTGLSATSPSTHKPNTLRAFRYYPWPSASTKITSLIVFSYE